MRLSTTTLLYLAAAGTSLVLLATGASGSTAPTVWSGDGHGGDTSRRARRGFRADRGRRRPGRGRGRAGRRSARTHSRPPAMTGTDTPVSAATTPPPPHEVGQRPSLPPAAPPSGPAPAAGRSGPPRPGVGSGGRRWCRAVRGGPVPAGQQPPAPVPVAAVRRDAGRGPARRARRRGPGTGPPEGSRSPGTWPSPACRCGCWPRSSRASSSGPDRQGSWPRSTCTCPNPAGALSQGTSRWPQPSWPWPWPYPTPRLRRLALAVVGAVGIARIYTGVHLP